MQAIFTKFDKSAMPANLLTHAEWRKFGRLAYDRPVGWKTAMRRYAEIKGGALLWRADDSLVAITKLSDGKLRQTTYKPDTWGWA